jgi:hypothetical protein
MTEHYLPLTVKSHIYQILEQFPLDRLPEISLFLEQLLKVVNSSVVNPSASSLSCPSNSSPQTEQPWLKYTAVLKDSPNWDEFLEVINENRREEHEMI